MRMGPMMDDVYVMQMMKKTMSEKVVEMAAMFLLMVWIVRMAEWLQLAL